jgi:hypothetical protein
MSNKGSSFTAFSIMLITATISALALMVTLVLTGKQGIGVPYQDNNLSNDYFSQKFKY